MSLMLFAILFAACPGDEGLKGVVATTKIRRVWPSRMVSSGQ